MIQKTLITTLTLSSMCCAYTVHEWGTFTSISGSDGKLLSGLQREEEHLPPFVHALDGMQNIGPIHQNFKGLDRRRPLRGVTIKMETPVIYFYSKEAFKALVEVGFQGGSISQWFPQRSGGESISKAYTSMGMTGGIPLKINDANFKKSGGIDFSKRRKGNIQWDVEVLSPETSRGLVFKRNETLNWLRPRNPKANVVKVGNEYEDYLFYRGLGNFKLPVTFSVDDSETLHIENKSDEKIPFLFVQEVTDDLKVRFHKIENGLAAKSEHLISEESFINGEVDWQKDVYNTMTQGLLSTGLNNEEAHGMVQTWWDSYFEKPGLRVFWIVPEDKTNEILPLKISPTPEKTVRVLVGRSEVLRPKFEEKLVTNYKDRSDKKKHANWSINIRHRYGLAFHERVMELIKNKVASVK